MLFCLLMSNQYLEAQKKYATMGYLDSKSKKFDALIAPDTKIEILSEGYTWIEGPVWVPKLNALLFSDVPKNTAYIWTEKEGAKVFLKPSGYSGEGKGKGSNGLVLDNKGDLILCQTGDRQIAKLKLDDTQKKIQVLASHYKGKRLNATNDAVVDSKGNIYFTDPVFGKKGTKKELNFQGVYKLNTKGKVQLVSKTWITPNGIGLSPDEKTLYVAYSNPNKLVATDIAKDGSFKNERVLFDTQQLWKESKAKQKPDGMAVYTDGTIFMTGPDGVLLLSPKGKYLGTIKTETRIGNCTFNEDKSILYITADDKVLRVKIK